MKFLQDYQHASEKTKRLERKFIMSQGQSQDALSILLVFGFSEIYPHRQVNSIYFDDIEHSCLRDNIDGVPNRDKLRVRYYGQSFNEAKIEIKHRRSNLGYKSTFPLSGKINTRQELIVATQKWCAQNVLNAIYPTAHVQYSRNYYAKGPLRATLDYNVKSGRMVESHDLSSSMQNYEVVEFKYPVSYDEEFRTKYKNIDRIALRNTKSSKYANAMMW
ncbi:VTC domain-containing protein [Amylibacter sp.]|jgi:hypothetical protein|nr:VTC domain-containing protein [Amylibacter sp.]